MATFEPRTKYSNLIIASITRRFIHKNVKPTEKSTQKTMLSRIIKLMNESAVCLVS